MFADVKFIPPAESSCQRAENGGSYEDLETRPIRLNSIRQPEQRLWKLCAQAVSRRCELIEIFIFVVFLVITLTVTISCFAVLSHLLESDAVCNAVSRLLMTLAGSG
jgi:hypothetical protein